MLFDILRRRAAAATSTRSSPPRLIGVFQYYGFEACGDVAEEVPDPTRRIPKAMRMTIYVGGAAAIFVCLSLLLAVPDFGAVISGEDTDPVATVLNSAFGEGGTKIVLGVVLISFLSCALSLMAAASRLMYSYARDDMIFGLPPAAALRPDAPRAAVRDGGGGRRAGGHRARVDDLRRRR